MKNRLVVRVQNGCQRINSLPSYLGGWLGAWGCRCPASQERVVLNTAGLGKDHHSQFEVQFLLNVCHSCTVVRSYHWHRRPSAVKMSFIVCHQWSPSFIFLVFSVFQIALPYFSPNFHIHLLTNPSNFIFIMSLGFHCSSQCIWPVLVKAGPRLLQQLPR